MLPQTVDAIPRGHFQRFQSLIGRETSQNRNRLRLSRNVLFREGCQEGAKMEIEG